MLIGNLIPQLADYFERLGRAGIFLTLALWKGITPPFKIFPIIKQSYFIGARSFLVILAAGTFVGMVVALLFYDTLVRFGSVAMLGSAVGISLIWELGPVLTALIIIGRAGSSICAEISIMRNENQIDALECMAIEPIRYLITPRILAAIICVPLLTALFVTVGIIGGYFVGVHLYGVSPGSYLGGMYDTVLQRDLIMGSAKAFAFGIIFIWIATVKGYYIHLDRSGAHGTEGVSKVTTDTVVLSSITVLFSDFLLSAIIL